MSVMLDQYQTVQISEVTTWFKAVEVDKVPINGGVCILYKGRQIAVYNFTRRGAWYACQNLCPHKMEMVLSRGMIGVADEDIPKVACPLHKRNYSLIDGEHINGEGPGIAVYPTKIEQGFVYIGFKE